MRPVAGVRLSVVLDRSEAVYSGMVPGFVAGEYTQGDLEIDVVPLARRARARVVLAAATGIDPVARRIELEGRPPLRYDVASLDVGSRVRGLELPGAREYARATRPIRRFVDETRTLLEGHASGGGRAAVRVLVVGGGAAGLELAFCIEARLGQAGAGVRVEVLCESPDLLPGHPPRFARRLRQEAARRGIRVRCGARVVEVRKDGVEVVAGPDAEPERLPGDEVVWATGAAAHPWLARSGLPVDDEGFVRVRPSLTVVDHDDLFAVGDCASLDVYPGLPKAGVYAVRQGPVLDSNLRATLLGRPLRRYRAQRDFLALLNLGHGRAVGAKWGVVAAGRPVWRLKDWIDRRFMRRFRVLETDGAPSPGFPSPEAMKMDEMPCGGCAAKVGVSVLERALARLEPARSDDTVLLGLDRPDDTAALATPSGDVLLATVDAFRAFTDDPWWVGRVAAVNAVSDVHAKGGRPRHALCIVTVPDADPVAAEETLFQVLSGVRAALDPMQISLVGGHTTSGGELFVGLAVTGELGAAREILPLDGASPGERLVLSKALGSGVVLAADMQGRASGAWLAAALCSMAKSNEEAARIARAAQASACTDVSGFGLAGHLSEILRASGAAARVELSALPALPGARGLLARGVRSTFHEQNAIGRRGLAIAPEQAADPSLELLFDPQTSGGLLFRLPSERAAEAVRALRDSGADAAVVGRVIAARSDGVLLEVAP